VKPQIVVCNQCKAEFSMNDNTKATPVGNGVFEWGLVCPSCDAYSFIYFETPVIFQAREKLHLAQKRYNEATGPRKLLRLQDLQRAKVVFKRVYGQEQKRWRKKRGRDETTPVVAAAGGTPEGGYDGAQLQADGRADGGGPKSRHRTAFRPQKGFIPAPIAANLLQAGHPDCLGPS